MACDLAKNLDLANFSQKTANLLCWNCSSTCTSESKYLVFVAVVVLPPTHDGLVLQEAGGVHPRHRHLGQWSCHSVSGAFQGCQMGFACKKMHWYPRLFFSKWDLGILIFSCSMYCKLWCAISALWELATLRTFGQVSGWPAPPRPILATKTWEPPGRNFRPPPPPWTGSWPRGCGVHRPSPPERKKKNLFFFNVLCT